MKNRIEGLINIAYLSDFDEIVSRLIDDLQKEEPFETDDIIEYLSERIVYREGSPEAEADWDKQTFRQNPQKVTETYSTRK